MSHAILDELLRDTTGAILKPREKIPLSKWAEREIVLPPGVSHYSGPYRSSLAPHSVEVLDTINDPAIREVTNLGPAQSSKSLTNTIALGYFMSAEPCSILAIFPVETLLESYSKNTLGPIIKASPVLSRVIDVGSRRDSTNKIEEKSFPGGSIFLGSGGTLSTFVQRSCRIVLLEDIDQLAQELGEQGDPTQLAYKRAETYPNRKILNTGTPTTERSHIVRAWKRGDRRILKLPCPFCGEHQNVFLEKLKYEIQNERVAKNSIFLPCDFCKEKIPGAKAEWMRARPKWIRGRETNGHASFWVTGGAFEAGWKPWAELVDEFLEVKDNPESLRTYHQTTLARQWFVRREVPSWERLYHRKKTFKRGEVPAGALALTLSCDVQRDRLEVLLMGYGRRRQRYIIEHYLFGGRPEVEETWAPLKSLMERQWPAPLLGTGVDCSDGVTSSHVIEFVRRMSIVTDRIIALKGASHWIENYVDTARKLDTRIDGIRAQTGIRIWLAGTQYTKSELYAFLRLDQGREFPPGWIFFADGFDEEFFQQVVSETTTQKKIHGSNRNQWIKLRERNEALDLIVLGTATAAWRGWATWTDEDWAALERAKKRAGLPSNKPAKQYGLVDPGITLD